uniref:Uncharacterized protein n=1 Tax=Physcomitrium patens TaxID=3218 RepID=A0A2K1KN11_PHYPA|nr:hypothetical protein PHYPA_006060 [Physcomitrium patens]
MECDVNSKWSSLHEFMAERELSPKYSTLLLLLLLRASGYELRGILKKRRRRCFVQVVVCVCWCQSVRPSLTFSVAFRYSSGAHEFLHHSSVKHNLCDESKP